MKHSVGPITDQIVRNVRCRRSLFDIRLLLHGVDPGAITIECVRENENLRGKKFGLENAAMVEACSDCGMLSWTAIHKAMRRLSRIPDCVVQCLAVSFRIQLSCRGRTAGLFRVG